MYIFSYNIVKCQYSTCTTPTIDKLSDKSLVTTYTVVLHNLLQELQVGFCMFETNVRDLTSTFNSREHAKHFRLSFEQYFSRFYSIKKINRTIFNCNKTRLQINEY